MIYYYREHPEKLVWAITEYKRLHKIHKKDELYLVDLLKKQKRVAGLFF